MGDTAVHGSSSTLPAPRAASPSVADRIKEQRRRYAQAVLQGFARTHQGRPTAQIEAGLRDALRPLGLRPRAVTLRRLAVDIAAGRPVAL